MKKITRGAAVQSLSKRKDVLRGTTKEKLQKNASRGQSLKRVEGVDTSVRNTV